MADSNAVPGYSGTKASRDAPDASGRGGGGDVTLQPGQYPPGEDHGIFGGPLPDGTGAPGTAGGRGGTADPTVEDGQLTDDFTGNTAEIARTGAPGTSGAEPSSGSGGDSVTITRPGSYLSGSYAQETVRDDIAGAGNWTEANDSGYGTGGPQLPGIQGNEPKAGQGPFQPGSGRVLRGGRAVRG